MFFTQNSRKGSEMEQFQPVLGRLVSGLGVLTLGDAAMLASVGVGGLARNAGRSGKMRSALFSVVLGVVATLVCGNVSAQPAAVTNFTAQEDDQRVTLSWDRPAGAIMNYEYRQSTDGGATWSDWAYIYVNRGTTRHTATLTGLMNGTEYTFQVRAVSAAGNGAESASETATPELQPLTIMFEGISASGDTIRTDSNENSSITIDIPKSYDLPYMRVVVTGGRGPYTYGIGPTSPFSTALPDLAIDGNGFITATPMVIGSFETTVSVRDALEEPDALGFTIRVIATPLKVHPGNTA